MWGYQEENEDGTNLIQATEKMGLELIHDPKLEASFNSRRWGRGYNPDLIFVTHAITSMMKKSMMKPIPGSQHRPICLSVKSVITSKSNINKDV